MNSAQRAPDLPLFASLCAWTLVLSLSGCGSGGDAPSPPASGESAASSEAEAPASTPVSEEDRAAALKLFRAGQVEFRGGKAQAAAEAFRAALALDPGLGPAWLALGKVLVYQSDVVVGTPTRDLVALEEACDALQLGAALQPDAAEAHFWLAEALALNGRKPEAIQELQRALGLKPDYGQAQKALALIHVELGDGPRAKQSFLVALRNLPEDADLRFRYGQELELDDDLEGAREVYEKSIAIDWTVPAPHSKLAVVLDRLGDAEGAAREMAAHDRWTEFGRRLRAAVLDANEDKRQNAARNLTVVALYREAARNESALSWLAVTLKADPTPAEGLAARVLACACALDLPDLEAAAIHFDAAAKWLAMEGVEAKLRLVDEHVRPTDHVARRITADALRAARRWPEAIRRYEALLGEPLESTVAEAVRSGLERAQSQDETR